MKPAVIPEKSGHILRISIGLLAFILLPSAQTEATSRSLLLGNHHPDNEAAYLPPQCFVKTVKPDGQVRNSCYVCHRRGNTPNFLNDSDLQVEALFPQYTSTNHFLNTLTDRSNLLDTITDDEIVQYIRRSNYFSDSGGISIAERLSNLPPEWDYNGDGQWQGFIPDCFFNFDEQGFDRNPDGRITGWRAYSYYPFPATHFPSGGGASDVMIRLPEIFRTNATGQEDLETYQINLAIIESLIKREDIKLPATVDETRYQVDLDKDGFLSLADTIVFDWAPLEGRFMSYVGAAKSALEAGETQLAAGLFPVGVEFLNTLRYQDTRDGDIVFSDRMKEIRYFRKYYYLNYAQLDMIVADETKERHDFPDRLRQPVGNFEIGVSNDMGWVMQGFIEDARGDLRPQSFEETLYCIGCHGGVGATADSVFSFRRKLDHRAPQAGWAHWSQRNYQKGMNEPKVEFENAGLQYEYAFYLMYAASGDDFSSNPEVQTHFFDEDGYLRDDMAAALHDDISLLLYPSPERALALNKTYKTIVEEQSFTLGRDAIVGSLEQVDDFIDYHEEMTGIIDPVNLKVDAREFPTTDSPTRVQEQSPDWINTVHGAGMDGPSGQSYQVDWQGFIRKSDYGLQQDGVYFRFPPRQTLPTRIIAPLGQIESCYACHRIPTTVPDQNPQVTVPVTFDQATNVESELRIAQLTTNEGRELNPRFSPDGSFILYESQTEAGVHLWRMDPDGSNKQRITTAGEKNGWARFSPDGQRLTYWQYDETTGTYRILNSRIDGNDTILIHESNEPLDSPDFSPDGNYIAYAALKDNNWDIWIAAADGSARTRVTKGPHMETNPLWKPQGFAISFKMAPTQGEYNLTEQFFMTFENGFDNPTVHEWEGVQSIQMSDWSPDGTMVAYTAEIVTPASGEDRVSYAGVVERITWDDGRARNGEPVLLAGRATLGDRGLVFSPDNRRVAFWAWDQNYRATLWIADVDGSNLRQLTTIGHDMAPKWSPDGSTLVFESTRAGNQDIWKLDL